jgi:hypothetical protein
MHLWAGDRTLYEPDVWSRLLAFLEVLMQRDLVSFAVVESIPSKILRLLGGVSFIHPEYIGEAKAHGSTLLNTVMRAGMDNREPFLSVKEVAQENARGELWCLTLLGNMEGIDLADPSMADFYRASNEGHKFFHLGYAFRAIWMEVRPPRHVQELQEVGMSVDRQLPIAGGRAAALMRLTREEALARPFARFSGLFFPPKPRFRLSVGEQRLLEYSLLDVSDEEATQELHLSEDAVKKRWRSIYSKVDIAHPALLEGCGSGAARRRALLHYLRKHLEELRPYHYAAAREGAPTPAHDRRGRAGPSCTSCFLPASPSSS